MKKSQENKSLKSHQNYPLISDCIKENNIDNISKINHHQRNHDHYLSQTQIKFHIKPSHLNKNHKDNDNNDNPFLPPQILCDQLVNYYFSRTNHTTKSSFLTKNIEKIIANQQLLTTKRYLSFHKKNVPLIINSSNYKNVNPFLYKRKTEEQLHKMMSKQSILSLKTLIDKENIIAIEKDISQRKVVRKASIIAFKPIKNHKPTIINYVSEYLGRIVSSDSEANISTYFALNQVFGLDSYKIFGVCDGKGPEGRLLSLLVKEKLIECLTSYSFNTGQKITEDYMYDRLTNNNYVIIKNMLIQINNDIAKDIFDIENNGTTVALLFFLGKRVISVNIGDSQAFLLKRIIDINMKEVETLVTSSLTELHSVHNAKEKDRVEDVLIDNNDELFNKLEITRCLGMNKYAINGLNHNPYIQCYTIEHNWKTIIIGTRNLWNNCAPYNIFKVNLCPMDLIKKMEQIVYYKERHLATFPKNESTFALIIINFLV